MGYINWTTPSNGIPVPTYGNYGGLGWTGGQRGGTNFDVPPVNALDAIFRKHDMGYADGQFYRADQVLLYDLQQLADSAEWGNLSVQDKAYAYMASAVFTPNVSSTKLVIGTERGFWEAYGSLFGGHCFPRGTPILVADGSKKPIEDIKAGDWILAFDSTTRLESGCLVAKEVTRLFRNVTTELLILRAADGSRDKITEIVVTPGHHFLRPDGGFERIDSIVSEDGLVVLEDGSAVQVIADRVVYGADTAYLYEGAERVVYESAGANALAPRVERGWATYNFEVEDLHTYIAAGLRVHNDSILDFVPGAVDLTYVGVDENGVPREVSYVRLSDGVIVDVTGVANAAGDTIRTSEVYDIPPSAHVADGATLSVERSFDPASGAETERHVTEFQLGPQTIDVGTIGNILGSQIGAVLGGNSLVGRVAAGTLIGTIAQEVGQALQNSITFALTDVRLSDVTGALSLSPIEDGIELAFQDFGKDLGNNFPGRVIGQLSGLLVGELANALGLHGFERGLFISGTSTITAQLVNNVFTVVTTNNAAALFNGFNVRDIVGGISGAVGGFVGGYYGAQVIMPDNPQAAYGTQIGSAIGAYLGTFIPIPILGIGNAIGAFLGSIAGTLIGNVAGVDPKSWGSISIDAGTGELEGHGFGADNGGDWHTFVNIATSQADALNALVDLTGGRIDTSRSSPLLNYNQKGTTFGFTRADGTVFQLDSVSNPSRQLEPIVNAGLMALIDDIDIVGGDILLRRAWEHSTATQVVDLPLVGEVSVANATAFAADLQVAKCPSVNILIPGNQV